MREITLSPGEAFIAADGTKITALAPRQIETPCIPMIVKTAGGLDVPRDAIGCPIDPAMFGPGEYDRDKGVISFSLAEEAPQCSACTRPIEYRFLEDDRPRYVCLAPGPRDPASCVDCPCGKGPTLVNNMRGTFFRCSGSPASEACPLNGSSRSAK